ncbi:branched-chain amino acid ABC transporter permease [Mesorhizobium sp. L-8-10]|uniref:branched-chain amino acid ABC transporter permease n=1 Tax=Mesorhizobium sp. L-8-10 TaxID=2744523 RepID=UPI0019278453|nr:branched-chain amino acid ABC transporter permease [Mesorhizobium sp. L-8-10]BCH29866.1 branched-chain amino acid ABC transporter permease [Mesorhizobium sp. L-8-10]
MNFDIALFLLQDGTINAAIYALLALSLILVFSVTRVICLPQGEFVTYGALTLALLQQGLFPATIYVVLVFGFLAAAYEVAGAFRATQRPSWSKLLLFLFYPPLLLLVLKSITLANMSLGEQIFTTFCIVVPLGPMVYRVVFQPLADTSILVLLVAAVAAHLVLVGIGLLIFGPEGFRTVPLSSAVFQVGPMFVSGQSIVVVIVSVALMLGFALALSMTLYGKALRATAVNRVGARIVGIRPEAAGTISFALAAGTGVLCGILMSPITTVHYDTGFVIALKGFVAAIIGGLISYPIALLGAVFVGIVEAFASFWASAYREVIVFAMIVPVLLLRSLKSASLEGDE